MTDDMEEVRLNKPFLHLYSSAELVAESAAQFGEGWRLFVTARNGDSIAVFVKSESDLPDRACGYGIARWEELKPASDAAKVSDGGASS